MTRGPWRRSVRVQLLALMGVMTIPLIVAMGILTLAQRDQRRAAASDRIEQTAELMASRVDDWIESANTAFLTLEGPVRRRWDSRETLDSLLGVASRINEARFINFLAVDTLGINRGSGRPTSDRDTVNFLERDYFINALASSETVVGAPRRSIVLPGRPWIVMIARALRLESGRPYGVIATPIRIDTLTDFIDVSSFEERPLVTIVDTAGKIVVRSIAPDSFIGRSNFADGRTRPTFPDSTTIDVLAGVDGVMRITASARARRVPWMVKVGIPREAVEAPIRKELRDNVLLSLLALLVAGTGGLLIGGKLARPLTTLASDAREIADGATNLRSAVSGPSEVESLRDAMNVMAETSERRSAAITENEQRYRFLFESNPLPMWAWNAETLEILAINDAAILRYGYSREEFLTQPITMLLHPSELAHFNTRRLPFTEGSQNAGIWKHQSRDGEIFEMEIITTSSRRLGAASWLSIGIDVTARKLAERALAKSEEQLRQSQKMEAVGAFAGGIAHDFNNLLTGIIGFCELALADLSPEHAVRPDLIEVRALAERGADLTRQILAVSRRQVLQPSVISLNMLVRDMERLFARVLGEEITINTQLLAVHDLIVADRGQFEQVLLNLVANARDAMPHHGQLEIETAEVRPEQAAAYGVQPEHWVMLRVADTGTGMSATVRERIFEPFFTTKDRGKGTGLGLALVYAMVDQVGGVLTCESVQGKGTDFRLFFPYVDRELDATPEASPSAEWTTTGSETVLLAEDEITVRLVAAAALERSGYRVLSAGNGADALATANNFSAPIHLLLTDVVMPGMHGRELAEALRASRPDTRVLFASGYTDDKVLLRGIRIDDVYFIQKPFTPQQLTRRVRDVLDAPLHPVTR